MKKLRNIMDGGNKVVAGALNLPDYVNHYATADGTAIELPEGARVMGITPLDAEGVVWVKTGTGTVAAAAPSGVTDGTAAYPVVEPTLLEVVPGSTHFAVASATPFTVAFWS